jgi:hypothetical protein
MSYTLYSHPPVSKQVPSTQLYEYFGDQIIITHETRQLWENEKMLYWRTFEQLVSAMKKEREAKQSSEKADC